jgi:hypothetical protein
MRTFQLTEAPERAAASRHLPPSSNLENYLLAKRESTSAGRGGWRFTGIVREPVRQH